MRDITVRQLEYLVALRQHGHFRKAAEDCGVSQPGLSTQLKKLEDSLGVCLFERNNRSVRITPLGETLCDRADQVLRAIDDLQELASLTKGALNGPLRLGIIPSMAPYLIRYILTELGSVFPECDPSVSEALTETLSAGLVDGALDVAIMAVPTHNPAFEEHAIFDDPFLLATKKNALGAQQTVTSEDVDFSKLLLLEEGHCLRDQALEVCSFVDADHLKRFNVSNLYTLLQMVSTGVGHTLLPAMALSNENELGDISVYRFNDPAPFRTVGLVWRKTSVRAEEYRKLVPLFSNPKAPFQGLTASFHETEAHRGDHYQI